MQTMLDVKLARSQSLAFGAAAVSGFTELTRYLLPELIFLPCCAIALHDSFGSLESMAFGGIVAKADNERGIRL